jgi:hypothetical protein
MGILLGLPLVTGSWFPLWGNLYLLWHGLRQSSLLLSASPMADSSPARPPHLCSASHPLGNKRGFHQSYNKQYHSPKAGIKSRHNLPGSHKGSETRIESTGFALQSLGAWTQDTINNG